MARILLKLSGEALSGDKGTGFDESTCIEVAKDIADLSKNGIEIAIVIGGGNFWRGRTSGDMDRVMADQIGMLATVMNCLYMSDILRRFDCETIVMTPFSCGTLARQFNRDSAIKNLKKNRIVFFAGGTGHPYFSTDTTTVLRALEIKADTILLAKAVDGIYSADPRIDKNAVKYDRISIDEVVEKQLNALDMTASILCKEQRMPFTVFSLKEKDSIKNSIPDEDGKLSDSFNGTVVYV